MKNKQEESNTPAKQNSDIKNRMAVQKLLEKNMRQATGMFHSKELNERCFVNDLFKNFNLTPKSE